MLLVDFFGEKIAEFALKMTWCHRHIQNLILDYETVNCAYLTNATSEMTKIWGKKLFYVLYERCDGMANESECYTMIIRVFKRKRTKCSPIYLQQFAARKLLTATIKDEMQTTTRRRKLAIFNVCWGIQCFFVKQSACFIVLFYLGFLCSTATLPLCFLQCQV